MRKIWNGRKAQGMVEYILIIALIAIIAIFAVKMFGGKITDMFNKSSEKISDETKNIK